MERALPAIPKFLNQEDKVMFWTWTEAGTFLGVVCLVCLFGSILLAFVIGVISVHALKLMKNSPHGDLTKGGLYWISPFSKKRYKSFPPSHIREFVG